jgi:hypothetical protein
LDQFVEAGGLIVAELEHYLDGLAGVDVAVDWASECGAIG